MRSLLTLSLFCVCSLAQAGFFSDRCLGGYEAIARVRIIPRAEAEAKRQNLPPKEAAEFVARRLRLSYLESKRDLAQDSLDTTKRILGRYERALIDHAEISHQETWHEVLRNYYPEVVDPSQPYQIDSNLLQGILPDNLSVERPPANIALTYGVATLEANLALYRHAISEALCTLPLENGKTIGEYNEHELAPKFTEGEASYLAKRRAIEGKEPVWEKYLHSHDVLKQADRDLFIVNEGKKMLTSDSVPAHAKTALKDQIDFSEKYGLSPNRDFWQLVFTFSPHP